MAAIAAQGASLCKSTTLATLSSAGAGDGGETCQRGRLTRGVQGNDVFQARSAVRSGSADERAPRVRSLLPQLPPRRRKFSSQFLPSISRQELRAKQKSSKRGNGIVSPCASAEAIGVRVEQLRGAREALKEIIQSKYCNPILVRLGWHDSGTYNKEIQEWPTAGGATASIRFKPEIDHGANAGERVAGGPKIPMRYGRLDASSPEFCAPDGNLPDAAPPSPADHLRKVFYRMGLNDKDIVALSGAHTIGRSRPDRSGFGKESTKYTKDGPGAPGGQSWTPEWLVFDNSYFKEVKAKRDEDLLVLPTDAALFEDEGFKAYAEKYAEDQEAFFRDYAESHAKLSELGCKFDPPEGIVIDEPASAADSGFEKFVAAKYSAEAAKPSPKKDGLSPEMREKIRKEYVGWGGSPDEPTPNYFLYIIIGISVLAVIVKFLGIVQS
ncbi:hypothetical protein CBR_g540 [Chara braunii]|uniref:L-ascorbate peroxidase n=1 Tax=Chara braunii TaxID=69332 RepID=A0A388KBG5_CHABU|nr:hypothetical protein CBR_g540 [Chara braunii]|eukprot:GBG67404.1 hypothetical protein CBR_g540 [Chara braunii]